VRHRLRSLSGIVLAALLLAVPSAGLGQEAASGELPTKITSDRMRFDQEARTVTFEGQVKVTRPDFDLAAEKIVVHLAPEKVGAGGPATPLATDPGSIERIVAEGSVRIEREGRTGTAAKATYLVQEGLLKLEGDPVLRDGANTVTGEVVRLYFKDNRSEVVGGKKRVQAVFFTPGDAKLP
jgi:lipopolysaccharide export system protein LptA